MPVRLTRRAAARLLLSAPAAFALPKPLEGAPAPARNPATPKLSAAERRQFEKSVAQLRSTAKKIRELAIPMGTEPAFVFQPLLPKR
jgi:hypothetical protein